MNPLRGRTIKHGNRFFLLPSERCAVPGRLVLPAIFWNLTMHHRQPSASIALLPESACLFSQAE
jgi:hypothetical protein